MNKSIEESFIECIGSSLPLFEKKIIAYRFQCPYCQASGKTNKGKPLAPSDAKGFLYPIGNAWNYRCHKCDTRQSFERFLKVQYPLLHVSYVRLRDQLGTTGFQTNCPSLETLLKQQGTLSTHPPIFVPREHQQPPQPQAPTAAPNTANGPAGLQVTKLPPMRSPQQQAGKQSRLNHLMKQRQQQRRLREGW
jgi:hypothetical protein